MLSAGHLGGGLVGILRHLLFGSPAKSVVPAATTEHSASPPAPAVEDPKLRKVREFETTIAGMTHLNSNGTSRLVVAGQCKVGDALILEHEAENPVDHNAIRVMTGGRDSKQIGYLRSHVAERLIEDIDAGLAFAVTIIEIKKYGYKAPEKIAIRIDVFEDA